MIEFDHPNLVRLIGVAVQQRPWLCVLEYMEVSVGERDERNIFLQNFDLDSFMFPPLPPTVRRHALGAAHSPREARLADLY